MSRKCANDFVVFTQLTRICGQPTKLSAAVYGDGAGHFINLWIQDADGEGWQISLGLVGGPGWVTKTGKLDTSPGWPFQKLFGAGDGAITYPVSFYGIALDDGVDSFIGSGDIFIDDITALP